MGLRDYVPATAKIDLPGGDHFVVRGLALNDISVLLRNHYAAAQDLFDKYIGQASLAVAKQTLPDAGFDEPDNGALIRKALEIAPNMIAESVALAADEPELVAQVRTLPLLTQVEAVEAVVRLTLEAEGGMEKLIETVNKLTGSLAA